MNVYVLEVNPARSGRFPSVSKATVARWRTRRESHDRKIIARLEFTREIVPKHFP